jgi:glutamate/tyrosine decarboxylase-like PLP-dependent enzyme
LTAELEHLARILSEPLAQPDAARRAAWAERVVTWTLHHQSLSEEPIGRTATRGEMEALLREAPPEQAADFAAVLDEFSSKVAPFAFRNDHPRYLAFVPGAPNFPSVMGDWLTAAANFFAGVWLEAPGPTQVELLVLDWFKSFLGYPAHAAGALTSGGSEANLTALVVARQRLSFDERARAVLYASDQRHGSIDRAAHIIGLRPDQTRSIPADERFRLSVEALREAASRDRQAGRLPWCVAASAGATNTGAVDPLVPLGEWCGRERLWLHVDAAYGAPAALIPEGACELAGIGKADSITFDPHKWFAQTFEVGGLLVRDGRRLAETFALRPDYLQDATPEEREVNFCDHGIALTRRFRALKVWLSVKVLGLKWYRELVERCFRLADYAQLRLERAGCFEMLSPRQLSTLCFRYRPPTEPFDDRRLDQLNVKILDELRKTGRAFLSSTRLNGRVAIRMCFINWRTTSGDVDEVIRLLQEIGSRK